MDSNDEYPQQDSNDRTDIDENDNLKEAVTNNEPLLERKDLTKLRNKSSQAKKSKSNAKRATLTSNASAQSGALNLLLPVKIPVRSEENIGAKRSITIELSYARSNLEVVRLCVRELKWKEVKHVRYFSKKFSFCIKVFLRYGNRSRYLLAFIVIS